MIITNSKAGPRPKMLAEHKRASFATLGEAQGNQPFEGLETQSKDRMYVVKLGPRGLLFGVDPGCALAITAKIAGSVSKQAAISAVTVRSPA
jgi:hypothetical protein